MKVNEKVLRILEKYKDNISEDDLDEIRILFGEVSLDLKDIKKGDKVKIIKSEYKGRLGVFKGWNEEYGRKFMIVEFDLKGDMYKGKKKEKLFLIYSIERISK